MKQKHYLIFDIGGSKTRLAITDGKKFDNFRSIKTPKKFADGISAIKKYREENYQGRLGGIVGGIRGPLNKEKTATKDRKILSDWAGKNIIKALEKDLKTQVVLENDADLAGLGEAVYGAGKKKTIVAYFTISTGVGGARIVKGDIDTNVYGFEPGKQIIDIGSFKNLEDHVSGPGIKKYYKKPAEEIRNKKDWERISKIIAAGIFNSLLHWSPDCAVLGGGVMKSLKIKDIKKHLQVFAKDKFAVPEIKKAKLEDKSGLYGAMALVKKNNI